MTQIYSYMTCLTSFQLLPPCSLALMMTNHHHNNIRAGLRPAALMVCPQHTSFQQYSKSRRVYALRHGDRLLRRVRVDSLSLHRDLPLSRSLLSGRRLGCLMAPWCSFMCRACLSGTFLGDAGGYSYPTCVLPPDDVFVIAFSVLMFIFKLSLLSTL